MTPSHRYRYAYLISLLGLFGIAVAVLLPDSSSTTEVSTVDEPTTTSGLVPPTTTATTVPETTAVPVPETTTLAPATTVVVEPTTATAQTEVPQPETVQPEATAAVEIPAAPVPVAAEAIPAEPEPEPAVRVEKGCVDDLACTAPPAPEYRQPPDWASCPQWWETAQAAGWPASAMDTLDYVMRRESGCSPTARNPSGATGLVQLMPMHWRGKFDPTDPFLNLHKGYELWTGSGWAPWEVCGFRRGC